MSYYDEDFKPWQIVDGQCVVADEAEWGKLLEWDLLRSKFPKGDRTIVKVTTDIFEGVTEPVVNSKGERLFYGRNGEFVPEPNEYNYGAHVRSVNPSDLLTRFLQTVDATQHVDYLLTTRHPELVREGAKRNVTLFCVLL